MGRHLSAKFVLGRGFGVVTMAPKGRRVEGGVQVVSHRLTGSSLVAEWSMKLYLNIASTTANC